MRTTAGRGRCLTPSERCESGCTGCESRGGSAGSSPLVGARGHGVDPCECWQWKKKGVFFFLKGIIVSRRTCRSLTGTENEQLTGTENEQL